ncbi:unnamed protein product [Didymodactylos carnosus]|uniref:Uncharacterized protein n=1 Tax=Didymodactylos carnosus TaxID=1234261 RepID=A0A8S2FPN3_9BILA|nr:unnamed protein product [Didymodactylos carnosus]
MTSRPKTATALKICDICRIDAGNSFCPGCDQTFCSKHFIEHRQQLSRELDTVISDHDYLVRKMEENTNPKLFEDIDAWEIDAIGKVKETAEQVRQELRQILNAPLKQLKCLTDDVQREKRL